MSTSGAQVAAFIADVTRDQKVWLVRDDNGIPAPVTEDGRRAMAFWSTSARAGRAARIWGGGLRSESITLEVWRDRWLPGLEADGLLVGLNWAGPRLTGWDLTVAEVQARLDEVLTERPGG